MFQTRIPSVFALITAVGTAALMAGCAQMSAQNITSPTAQGGVAKPYHSSTTPETIEQVGDKDPDTGSNATWGAIASIAPDNIMMLHTARSISVIGFGIANNRATQQEAVDAALTMCKNDGESGCKVRYIFQGQCATFFVAPDTRRSYGWAVAPELYDAAEMADETCMQQNTGNQDDCVPFYVSCPDSI